MLSKKGGGASGGGFATRLSNRATDAAYQRKHDDKMTPEAAWPRTRQCRQHERARQDWSNRARYADRYFDIVLASPNSSARRRP